ncbi:TPA: SPI-1 type III secretion system guanine nucleotide exchange factor SopE [Salmonella enterica subsp. enterica serovar Dublin]|nr:SPI-1 type III secretion system guanine nucleotide exchange factor SopE [Salmonella enterica subsp. enterica serovar Dublin]HDO8583820.1 SPI-1 type III secretion system guanine nucleotide exchange factor SopE [Salmonella enterica subsp. enterica serovar Dublin]HDO8685448.1 SPI-1 type III secretion system guanine nucleotide exchange factor SopE [Salmonella enterica subsp. enterica serovar Dublin]HDP0793410.1 SPI-1 type III secretion system guanine nucleotide exchange factor SopE [Salmonella en
MTKITLFPHNFRIQKQEATPLKGKSTEKNSLAKSILAVKNHFIKLNSKLSERFISHKNTESSATHFHRGSASEGRAVLTNKVVKNFMLQTLHDIDIRGSASKDPAYASQTREAILSAVYSKYKDQYCNLLISKGIDIAPFLKGIGEAAQNAGLPGATKNDVFTPSGAGANPFITPLITSAYSKYPHMFTSQHQKASFNIYAEKIIMTEVVPLFNECAMPTPQQFQQILENIANKYIQNTP